jgi:hypothetical protein
MVVAYANKGRGRQPGFGISRYSGKTAIYRLRILVRESHESRASWDRPHLLLQISVESQAVSGLCGGSIVMTRVFARLGGKLSVIEENMLAVFFAFHALSYLCFLILIMITIILLTA